MKKIEKGFFELSKEEKESSMMMYDKIIKCLVVPYHIERELEIEYAPNIYLFPEKEIPKDKCRQFISMVVNNKTEKEALIITADMNIILDMVDDCVRILTENGEIVHSPEKTFAANAHTIIHCVLNNDDHKISKKEKSNSIKEIEDVISMINDNDTITQKEHDEIMRVINKIGEPIISDRLKDMLSEVTVI